MNQSNSPIYFMHYRSRDSYGSPLARGGATLAIQPLKENVIRVAVAKCSDKDNFNKKLGRTIALGRLNSMMETSNRTIRDYYDNPHVFDIIAPTAGDKPVKTVVAETMGHAFHEMGYE